MRRVFKYPLPVSGLGYVVLPEGARILSVGVQGEHPGVENLVLWALVDDAAPVSDAHRVVVLGTGHPAAGDDVQLVIDDPDARYFRVEMVQGKIVFHVWVR